MRLLGRERARATLDRLVESARDGSGGALVVHGEPGVGKTALLEDSVEKATMLRIVRSAGVEGEMELPFAAVQQLCASILEFGKRLPPPQRDALDIAFGLSPGPAPNPFLVALAVLGLLSEAAPMHSGIEASVRRRVAALPHDARLLVLIAASEPTGDATLVWRAAELLGITESAAVTAESSGLIAFRPRVAFRHPLVRSAVYRAAGAVERIEVHRALAVATDVGTDPDRRAWHRAQAAVMPDEDVAADLERSAARAQARA